MGCLTPVQTGACLVPASSGAASPDHRQKSVIRERANEKVSISSGDPAAFHKDCICKQSMENTGSCSISHVKKVNRIYYRHSSLHYRGGREMMAHPCWHVDAKAHTLKVVGMEEGTLLLHACYCASSQHWTWAGLSAMVHFSVGVAMRVDTLSNWTLAPAGVPSLGPFEQAKWRGLLIIVQSL